MSITKEENGTYTVQCRIREWDGRIVHKKKRGFIKRRDAADWEKKMLENGGQIDLTLQEFAEVYFEDKKVDLKSRSIEHKRDVLRRHVFPYFGDRKIASIRPSDLIKWQNEMLTKGYKPTYLHDIQKHLSALFTHACKVYDLSDNPCKRISQMGKSEADKLEFWTAEEYNSFISRLQPGTMYYALFETLFWTGIRIGEALALTKGDIDLINHQISINKTYYRVHAKDVITAPKTQQSIRRIDIPSFLTRELQEYMDKIYGLEEEDRIFPVVAEAVQHKLKREIEAAGLKKIRVHDFRHSHVAYLINQGVDPLVIKIGRAHV